MKISSLIGLSVLFLLASCGAALADPQPEAKEQWRTAFYKRGFLGNYEAKWAGGADATLRTRVWLPFSGSRVRVTVASMRAEETVLSKMTLVPGAGAAGTVKGSPSSITFNDAPSLKLAAAQADVISDSVPVAVKPGLWYLQQSYSSPKFLYANGVDGYFMEPGDQHGAATMVKYQKGVFPGNIYRIEVLTADSRPSVLCYGDSITHGFTSSANSGQSYPEILGQLTQLPTLNMGLNGDLVSFAGGVPILVRSCPDVQSVVLLMGINDIITGKITKVDEYSKVAAGVIGALKQDGKKVYWGTILPAGGYAAFDKDPAKEMLRQGINTWIKTASGADAVIDFAGAVADTENPSRMRASYQNDWLHPNDAGYHKLAETAAAVLKERG